MTTVHLDDCLRVCSRFVFHAQREYDMFCAFVTSILFCSCVDTYVSSVRMNRHCHSHHHRANRGVRSRLSELNAHRKNIICASKCFIHYYRIRFLLLTFNTKRESTTQFEDLRLPCIISHPCKYAIPLKQEINVRKKLESWCRLLEIKNLGTLDYISILT